MGQLAAREDFVHHLWDEENISGMRTRTFADVSSEERAATRAELFATRGNTKCLEMPLESTKELFRSLLVENMAKFTTATHHRVFPEATIFLQANVGGAMTTGKDDPQTYVIDIHDDNVEQLSMEACDSDKVRASDLRVFKGSFRQQRLLDTSSLLLVLYCFMLPSSGQALNDELFGVEESERRCDCGASRGCLVSVDGALGQLQHSDVVLLKAIASAGTEESDPSFDIVALLQLQQQQVLGPLTKDTVLGEEMSFCLFETWEKKVGWGGSPRSYLGLGAKGRVLWLDPNATQVHEALLAADQNLSYIASVLAPFSGDVFEKPLRERTPALLSLSLDEEEEEDYPQPPVDDRMLGDFLSAWRRGLVRAWHFMGPSSVTLELETREGPAAAALPLQQEVIRLTADPGTLLLYRPECFVLSSTVKGESLGISATFLSAEQPRWFVSASKDFDPSRFQRERVFEAHRPRKGKVLHTATRLPALWDEPEMYSTGMNAGTDAVVEVPITRFDVTAYFTENPDEINVMNPKMNQKHTSFVDGIELFDNKYFEISNNEAVTMDPLQRQVLEVGGALLQQMGISKKVSNKRSHHVGVSVGVDKADFPTLGVMTGGNNALAIIANRFSFVFNLKGLLRFPDGDAPRKAVARLLLDRVWDVLDFHVATGTHLCLSPGPWVGCALGHMTSPQGRCFTFDSTANGYLRGEGTSGMILKYGDYAQASTIYRASQVGQDGRSASLTAPNGPAQEEIISRAIREAKMTPPESTCWECHGTGTSLGDPIEIGAVRKIQRKVPRSEPLMMSSNKTNIGHLEGGAAMAAMVKSVLTVQQGQCLASLHVRQLNPHLEHTIFDAFFETERSSFAAERGHDVQALLLRRIARMSPAEIRVIGNDPKDWEADLPEKNPLPGDVYSIVLRPEDPIDEPIKWVKVRDASEQRESLTDFYTVTGSFNSWQQDTLAPGAPGHFSMVVFVPSDGAQTSVLEFRFLKNGNEQLVLAPEKDKCTEKLARVLGPQEGLRSCWSVKAAPSSCVRLELLCLRNAYGCEANGKRVAADLLVHIACCVHSFRIMGSQCCGGREKVKDEVKEEVEERASHGHALVETKLEVKEDTIKEFKEEASKNREQKVKTEDIKHEVKEEAAKNAHVEVKKEGNEDAMKFPRVMRNAKELADARAKLDDMQEPPSFRPEIPKSANHPNPTSHPPLPGAYEDDFAEAAQEAEQAISREPRPYKNAEDLANRLLAKYGPSASLQLLLGRPGQPFDESEGLDRESIRLSRLEVPFNFVGLFDEVAQREGSTSKASFGGLLNLLGEFWPTLQQDSDSVMTPGGDETAQEAPAPALASVGTSEVEAAFHEEGDLVVGVYNRKDYPAFLDLLQAQVYASMYSLLANGLGLRVAFGMGRCLSPWREPRRDQRDESEDEPKAHLLRRRRQEGSRSCWSVKAAPSSCVRLELLCLRNAYGCEANGKRVAADLLVHIACCVHSFRIMGSHCCGGREKVKDEVKEEVEAGACFGGLLSILSEFWPTPYEVPTSVCHSSEFGKDDCEDDLDAAFVEDGDIVADVNTPVYRRRDLAAFNDFMEVEVPADLLAVAVVAKGGDTANKGLNLDKVDGAPESGDADAEGDPWTKRDDFQGLYLCTSTGVLQKGKAGVDVAMRIAERLTKLRLENATASVPRPREVKLSTYRLRAGRADLQRAARLGGFLASPGILFP
ncbi:Phthiocerol synthesis polyketide synthase type I PpsC [Symbiodinium microadriaticum]|uniref:Phthiocerol synthesis polyketide synthase type I PpsC n=1 Tax=Symbiodinium microadriaticum TaxID=2951 RepID=A0A1Q9DBI1_SYMMI|nr:Phthiocerol synthesis polyketide synthase type I PpsC [Symbiodinium microadriaticum]